MEYLLKEISVFVKIVERGSFRAAGEELNLTQSAMTQRMKKLEGVLGVRLIDRTTRRVAPTAIGQSFLPVARRMLMQFDRSMQDLDDLIQARAGHVTVASLISAATYVLPAALGRFGRAHPAVGVRVIDDAEQEIAAHVLRGEAEFGIDMAVADPKPDLAVTPLAEDRYVVICRDDHPHAGSGPIGWEALADMPLVLLGARSGTNRLLLAWPAARTIGGRWRYEVQHLSTLVGMVEEGVGVGIVPAMVLSTRPSERLVRRPLEGPDLHRTIVLVERRDAELSPVAERLKAMVIAEFARMDQRATAAA